MKLKLIKSERIELLTKGFITIERTLRNVPLSSIHYGIGNSLLWDKVDRVWVYGDTQAYKADKMNIDRRKTDYPNNTQNIWNGSYWWECEGLINEFDHIDKPIINRVGGVFTFRVLNIVFDRFANIQAKDTNILTEISNIDPETIIWKKPVLKYTITL